LGSRSRSRFSETPAIGCPELALSVSGVIAQSFYARAIRRPKTEEKVTLETVACNLCGSRRYTTVYEMPDVRLFPDEYFTVVECNECGLGFVNPRPDRQEIQKYYPRDYYQNEESASFARYLRKRFTQQARYLKEVEERPGPRKLLDVGCFNGEFPRFMAARGWDVSGVEISEASLRITEFPVFTEEFNEIPVHAPAYDAITAWAVLEHVHDPMAYFQKASQVLKKGGLFVFQMPNFVSTASRCLFWKTFPGTCTSTREKPLHNTWRKRGSFWSKKTIAGMFTGRRRQAGCLTWSGRGCSESRLPTRINLSAARNFARCITCSAESRLA